MASSELEVQDTSYHVGSDVFSSSTAQGASSPLSSPSLLISAAFCHDVAHLDAVVVPSPLHIILKMLGRQFSCGACVQSCPHPTSNDQFKTFQKSPSALQAEVFETLEGNEVKDLDSPGRQIPSAKAAAPGAGKASAGQAWQPCPRQL